MLYYNKSFGAASRPALGALIVMKSVSFVIRSFILIVLAILSAVAARAQTPSVIVTVKPIHSLVAAVMEGVALPELLIPGAASPHTFTLRPTDVRKLERAGIIVWLGEDLETFLAKPLATFGGHARIVTIATIPGLTLLRTRSGGAWDAADHDHDHASQQPSDGKARIDMHLWLDTRNAGRIATAVADALAEADPGQAARYRANLHALAQDLAALDEELRRRLDPVRGKPFIVFHDAYHYFEARYGLAAVGSITVSPERRPSARRVREIRAKIAESDARCVFREPHFTPRLAETVTEGSRARIGVLDPLGADIQPGPGAYAQIMRRLSENLSSCLGQP